MDWPKSSVVVGTVVDGAFFLRLHWTPPVVPNATLTATFDGISNVGDNPALVTSNSARFVHACPSMFSKLKSICRTPTLKVEGDGGLAVGVFDGLGLLCLPLLGTHHHQQAVTITINRHQPTTS